MRRYPEWLKRSFSSTGVVREVRTLIGDLELATVCESAWCPNLQECYAQRQLTFMILGDRCTRSCRFCAVDHGRPQPVSAQEPWRVAQAVGRLGLQHVVITSVARDDLQDEGAGQFVAVIRAVKAGHPGVSVEVLVPDFHGRDALIAQVLLEGRPEVFAHNLETIRRLSGVLRPQANYERSLHVLALAASLKTPSIVKSSLMVGVGECSEEVRQTLEDLRQAGVTHLTLGQYLRPSAAHVPVMEYVSPQQFDTYRRLAYDAGFTWVMAGPLVRSSYHAIEGIQRPAPQCLEVA